MKRWIIPSAILLGSLGALQGCVSINEGVQVQRPGETQQSQVVTEKCPVRPYLHRLIKTQGSVGSKLVLEGGPRLINSQGEFDPLWSSVNVEPGQSFTTQSGSDKPQVDWVNQQAAFIPVGRTDTTCDRIVPVRVETDCLRVDFYFSRMVLKGDCQSSQQYPVFIYIFPRTTLPMGFQWTDDADGDGVSNPSEIQVGTDPLDPNSKP